LKRSLPSALAGPADPRRTLGLTDDGDRHAAMMGNDRYDAGEKLGDLLLAAEQPVGKGRIIAFGDTSGMTNAINVSSYVFTTRLLAYLAGDSRPGISGATESWPCCVGALLIGLCATGRTEGSARRHRPDGCARSPARR
jgi:hypothetical protein